MKATMNESNPTRETSRVIKKLLLAIKNSNLYPPGHTLLSTCVTDLYRGLQSYLEHCSRLVIVIEKNRLVSDGQVLHEGTKDKENIAFLLHRDGVQWVSFENGIVEGELKELLDIFSRYRVKEEYDGGDIVTALWQANFFHIKYGTDDRLWKDEPILDISTLKVSDAELSIRVRQTEEQQHAESLAAAGKSHTLWALTEQEKDQTHRMIAEQEQRDDNLDVFDILLIILHEQNEKEDYSAVLDLVRECFERTLARSEFGDALTFLEKLGLIYLQYKTDGFWAQAHLDDFYIMISGQHLYTGLLEFIKKNKMASQKQVMDLRRLIALLPPQCIHSLGKLLPDANHLAFRRCILESIARQAIRNMGPLVSLTGHENESIAVPAVGLLAHIKQPEAITVLKRLVGSDRDRKRIAAVKAMVRHPLSNVSDFKTILNDEDHCMVKLCLGYLNRQPGYAAAKLVTDRLESGNFSKQDSTLLYALYDCLGRCDSEQTVAFLKRQLFKVRWCPGVVNRTHRTGAAVALLRLKRKEARTILDRASKSFRVSVRNACRQAREMTREPATE